MKRRELVINSNEQDSGLSGMAAATIYTEGGRMRSKCRCTKKSTKGWPKES